MAHHLFRLGFIISQVGFLVACVGTPAKDSEKGIYFDSAFNDHNQAPKSLAPSVNIFDGSAQNATLDPLYMRTQADYHFAMGESFSLEGNHQKAIEAFRATLSYDPNSLAVLLRLSGEYMKTGLLTEALDITLVAAEKHPNNVDVKLILGGIYASMRVFPKAVIEYEAAMKLKPELTDVFLYLGAIYSEIKDFEKAVKFFESLAKRSDYQAKHLAYYYIGRVRSEQKEEKYQKMAEQAFKKSIEIKPDFAEASLSLGSLYMKKNEEEKALQLYSVFQKKFGPNQRVADILSQLYIERERYDEAYEQFEILETQSENTLNVKLKMALILIEKKIYDKAVVKLEEVLKEAPESDKVRFYLGAIYEETKQDQKAINQFSKIPSGSQYFGEASTHTAYLLKGLGRLNEAIVHIEKAILSKKDNAQMVAMYASLLDEKGDIKKATSVLEKAILDFPENAQIRFYFGTLQDRVGEKARVIESMKKVIELDPNHVQALNYLAFTWAEVGVQLEEAEKLVRRAIELEPKDGYVLDTLGWILYKRGRVGQSIGFLEAAHRFQPTVGVIAEHLGDAYYRQAMIDKAHKMYQKALENETDIKKIEQIREKITSISSQELLSPRSPASLVNDK
jgi:tetratricopeptide (TPR) repeat protein